MKIKIKSILQNFEEIIAGGCLIMTTILVIINVILRYFFKSGLYWSEEVATSCFVWSVFMGAAAGYKRRMHVGITMLVDKLGPKAKLVATLIVDLILIFISGYILWMSINYLKVSYKKPTPVLGVSSAAISSSIFLSFLLMTIYSVYFFFKDAKGGTK